MAYEKKHLVTDFKGHLTANWSMLFREDVNTIDLKALQKFVGEHKTICWINFVGYKSVGREQLLKMTSFSSLAPFSSAPAATPVETKVGKLTHRDNEPIDRILGRREYVPRPLPQPTEAEIAAALMFVAENAGFFTTPLERQDEFTAWARNLSAGISHQMQRDDFGRRLKRISVLLAKATIYFAQDTYQNEADVDIKQKESDFLEDYRAVLTGRIPAQVQYGGEKTKTIPSVMQGVYSRGEYLSLKTILHSNPYLVRAILHTKITPSLANIVKQGALHFSHINLSELLLTLTNTPEPSPELLANIKIALLSLREFCRNNNTDFARRLTIDFLSNQIVNNATISTEAKAQVVKNVSKIILSCEDIPLDERNILNNSINISTPDEIKAAITLSESKSKENKEGKEPVKSDTNSESKSEEKKEGKEPVESDTQRIAITFFAKKSNLGSAFSEGSTSAVSTLQAGSANIPQIISTEYLAKILQEAGAQIVTNEEVAEEAHDQENQTANGTDAAEVPDESDDIIELSDDDDSPSP